MIPVTIHHTDGTDAPGALTTAHPASSYGIPIIIDQGNNPYGSADVAGYTVHWRELRDTLGVTQEALARRMGVSLRTVQGWEAGRQSPPLYAFAALCGMMVATRAGT